MTIASAITNAQQKVANAYTAISNKGGTLPATQNLANMPNAINTISTGGTINSLNVTPTTSAQTITASGGVDGYSPVNVSAVTASIDSNIQSRFIRNGVEILGITGTYGEPVPFLLSVGSYTTWYVNSSGELYGSGHNNYGQQSSGNTTKVTTFTKRADNVVQIVCSDYTTWYINSSGELYGCGRNDFSQQGSGDQTNVTTFTKRADNVVQISPYLFATTWYVNSSGELYGCGFNSFGQQGNGNTSDVITFTKRADNVVRVACSDYTTWYVNKSNEVYGCGYNQYGQQGSGNTYNVTTFTKRN